MESTTERLTVQRELEIAAAPETVWEFLVDPVKATRWWGTRVEMDARPGGAYRIELNPGHIVRGEFVELEQFHADEDDHVGYDRGAALAFEGSSPDAALFVAANETARRSAIVRVDAGGRVERIGELETNDESSVRLIHQMVWDDTRRTLWSAAGRAGVLGSTAPGAPVPVGKGAGAGASS